MRQKHALTGLDPIWLQLGESQHHSIVWMLDVYHDSLSQRTSLLNSIFAIMVSWTDLWELYILWTRLSLHIVSALDIIAISHRVISRIYLLFSPVIERIYLLFSPVIDRIFLLFSPVIDRIYLLFSPFIDRIYLLFSPVIDRIYLLFSPVIDRIYLLFSPVIDRIYLLFSPVIDRIYLLFSPATVNSLWPTDAIWHQGSGSTLAQVMACCLTAPSHYLKQCWLIISKVEWHSSEGSYKRYLSHQ